MGDQVAGCHGAAGGRPWLLAGSSGRGIRVWHPGGSSRGSAVAAAAVTTGGMARSRLRPQGCLKVRTGSRGGPGTSLSPAESSADAASRDAPAGSSTVGPGSCWQDCQATPPAAWSAPVSRMPVRTQPHATARRAPARQNSWDGGPRCQAVASGLVEGSCGSCRGRQAWRHRHPRQRPGSGLGSIACGRPAAGTLRRSHPAAPQGRRRSLPSSPDQAGRRLALPGGCRRRRPACPGP